MRLLDRLLHWLPVYREWRGGVWELIPGGFYEDGMWPGGIEVCDRWVRTDGD